MNRPLRIVVVDDSPFVCRLLASHLRSESGFEVVGTAHDGHRAIELILEHRPDVVTLDVEMPGLNGLDVLQHIMCECPTPTLMVSGVSRHAARVTMQALEQGAVDFILKYTPGVETDPEVFAREFISKVRTTSGVKVIRSLHRSEFAGSLPAPPPATKASAGPKSESAAQAPTTRPQLPASAVATRGSDTHLVVVGASTGGLLALREFLDELQPGFDAAVIIVQHMPATFTNVLAAQLARSSVLPVREAVAGDVLEPGLVLVAPGDKHTLVRCDGRVDVAEGAKVRGHRPSIDVTMQSAVQSYPGKVAGVVLTGMGDDGAAGLSFIHSKNGWTFAQDEASCVVFGMPQRAIERNVVDVVARPAEIARQLMKIQTEDCWLKETRSVPRIRTKVASATVQGSCPTP